MNLCTFLFHLSVLVFSFSFHFALERKTTKLRTKKKVQTNKNIKQRNKSNLWLCVALSDWSESGRSWSRWSWGRRSWSGRGWRRNQEVTCSVYALPLDPTQGPALKKGAGHEMKGGACMKGEKICTEFCCFFLFLSFEALTPPC